MSDEENMDCSNDNQVSKQEIFNPKKHTLNEEEQLEMDETAYIMYHELKVEHSCLSFDIIRDNLGSGEERGNKYPYTLHAVSGSQAATGHNNMLTIMKMSNLNKIKQKEGDSDSESESDDEMLDDDENELVYANIPHNGAVNRVRTTQINGQSVVASWSELGQVHVWDLSRPMWAVNDSAYMADYLNSKEPMVPLYTVRRHNTEGFAMDWSACKEGLLATGDNDGCIYVTMAGEHGYETATQVLHQHRSSVEDLQWSPNQDTIFASCSSDRSLLVWDTRDMKHHVTVNDAHSKDINVISWNRSSAFSMVSGGDDGIIKVWDLRMVRQTSPATSACTHLYDYHKDCAITSIEWCPDSPYVFACSSEDDQLTLWDISMEQETAVESGDAEEYPVHMLFNHMGQKEVKELHWHPQIPGLILSTALDGFNVFKTISV